MTVPAPRVTAPAEQDDAPLMCSVQRGDGGVFEAIADDWRALCGEGASDEPFYRPEWIGAYLRAFAPDADAMLFTAHAGPRLRAVLPLVHRRGLFSGIPARILESPSNVHSGRFDVIHGAGDGDAAVASLWAGLKSQPDWDVIVMRDAPAGGAAERLLGLAAADGWPVGQWSTNQTPVASMTGVRDPLSLLRHAHFRANLRRRTRKIAEGTPLSLERIVAADRHALDLFYAIEASGWKGRERTAIACDAATRRFYDDVALQGERFGYLALYILRSGSAPIAGAFGLWHRRRLFTPKIGFDERYAAFSPGHLLVEATLRDAIDRGIVDFDFLGPSMPWKLEWTSQIRAHSHCYIFRNSVLGHALHVARCGVLARVRPLIHRVRS